MNVRTPGATKIVGTLALLVVAGIGWLLVLGPATADLARVQEETAAARSRNDTLGLQIVALKRQAADLEGTRATAGALAAMFPPTADQPGLFRQVTDAAGAAGIGPRDVTALTPTPPTIGQTDPGAGVTPTEAGGDQLASQTVAVSVEGDFRETQLLMENLEALPRAYLIDSVNLAGGSVPGLYTTTITGDMFVMSPAPDPALAGAPGAAGDTAPADTR